MPKVFDADARQKARAEAGLRLGGKLYPRARRTNAITRELREIDRRDEQLHLQMEDVRQEVTISRLIAKSAQAAGKGEWDRVDEIEAELSKVREAIDDEKIEALEADIEALAFRKLEVLLDAPKDGEPIDATRLAENLDVEDAVELTAELLRVGRRDDERQEDPTDPTGGASRS